MTVHIEIHTKSDTLPTLINGSVLHSAQIFSTLERSKGCKPYMLIGYDSDGNEQGHLLIIKRRGIRLFPPVLGSWYTVNGEGAYRSDISPADREKIFTKFLDKIFDFLDFRHTYIEIQNIDDSRFAYSTLSSRCFIPRRDQRLYISLHSKEPQERLARAYKAHIRKAEERGVTHRQATTPKEILEGLKLMRNYYRSKIQRELPPEKTLRTMLYSKDGELSDKARLFIVEHKERIIGSSLCLYDEERAYLAYSCGLRKSHPLLYPGIMAIWAAITDAHKNKYAHFEFLEVRALPYFKRKFIGTLLNYGGKQVGTLRWQHFRWKWINKILRKIYV
ncbi:MAG: GNAT family N-acetyltransferase [Bacteroidaceae bacterium]|nr:GNAT family N-acetyltransferase [Bacteroidaceae bacterium]